MRTSKSQKKISPNECISDLLMPMIWLSQSVDENIKHLNMKWNAWLYAMKNKHQSYWMTMTKMIKRQIYLKPLLAYTVKLFVLRLSVSCCYDQVTCSSFTRRGHWRSLRLNCLSVRVNSCHATSQVAWFQPQALKTFPVSSTGWIHGRSGDLKSCNKF